MSPDAVQKKSFIRRVAREAVFAYRRHRTDIGVPKRIDKFLSAGSGAGFDRSKLICVSLLEHLGDIVACEPVARRIHDQEPTSEVIWCVGRPYVSLVQHNPSIDRVLIVDSMYEWGLWSGSGAFYKVLDLNMEGRPDFVHGVAHRNLHGNREVSIANWKEHGSLLRAFSKAAGLSAMDDAPRVYIPSSTREVVDSLKLPEEFVVIHCKSSSRAKDWDVSKWRALVDWLWTQWRLPTIEIGTTSELQPRPATLRALCGSLSILESAEVIRRARLFVGIDSGPAHLANAVGTRGVVLLSKWVPFSGGYSDGSQATLIRWEDGPLPEIPTEHVMAAAARELGMSRLRGAPSESDVCAPLLP